MGDPTPFSADPRLVAAEDAIHAAEDMFVQVQSLVQSECLHRLVVQSNLPTHVWPWRDQMTYNTLHTLHTLHTPEEPPA